jgi:hypothetical protein
MATPPFSIADRFLAQNSIHFIPWPQKSLGQVPDTTFLRVDFDHHQIFNLLYQTISNNGTSRFGERVDMLLYPTGFVLLILNRVRSQFDLL